MKSLSLAKPLIIMVVGLPGSGKSFFARQFSDTFGAPVVSVDRIRYELFTEPKYSRSEQQLIQRLTDYQVGELLKTKRSFVIDGGCNGRGERLQLMKHAKLAGYQSLVVWVQTDSTSAKLRSLRRDSRKEDDMYNASLSDTLFDTLATRFAPPIAAEPSVVVSGKHTYTTQLRSVLKKIVGPRQTTTPQPESKRNNEESSRTAKVAKSSQTSERPVRRSVQIN